MNSNGFKVVATGFSDHQRRLLHSMLILASSSQCRYELSYQPADGDVFIALMDASHAITQWRNLHRQHPKTPTLFVSQQPRNVPGQIWLRWPLEAKATISALHQLAQHRSSVSPSQAPQVTPPLPLLKQVGRWLGLEHSTA